MKNKYSIIVVTLLLLFALTTTAAAQEEQPELSIRLNRNFGTGGIGNAIQGQFTITVSGPDDLVEVQFYLDDQLMGTDTEAPFKLPFNTGNYESGTHTISALGILADGTELSSRWAGTRFSDWQPDPVYCRCDCSDRRAAPGGARHDGEERQRPPDWRIRRGRRHDLPSLPVPLLTQCAQPEYGKLERCPHCGKWSIRPRASQADLAAAEDRLRASRQETGGEIEVDEQEDIRRALDDLRFDN